MQFGKTPEEELSGMVAEETLKAGRVEPGESSSRAEKLSDEEDSKLRHDELRLVMDMFGTEAARNNFRELLDAYRELYLKDRLAHDTGITTRREFGRSGTHNEIMRTLRQLAIYAAPGSPEEEVLRKLSDRALTHEYIRDFLDFEARRKHQSRLQKFRQKGVDNIVIE